jgi:curved DNA-binding protein CbpA
MHLGRSAQEGQVPALAPGLDPARLPLSPAEGFLLSRIDGRTPWKLLREIGGLAPSEVDRCLERWLEEGVVVVASAKSAKSAAAGSPPAGPSKPASPAAPSKAAPAAAPPRPAAVAIDESLLDRSLDLTVEAQRRILAFEQRLAEPYHQLLGLSADADTKAVKRAYFELSKEFHPDRYFRRNTGPFGARLERIFKRILEAYELLSDPTARAEIERAAEERAAVEAAAAPPAAPSVPAPAASQEPTEAPSTAAAKAASVEATKRLRQLPHLRAAHLKQLAERRAKAKRFFESGMAAFKAERWLEAAGSVRLAIAFDPTNEAIREAFGDVQRKAHDERAKQLLREANAALDLRDARNALRLFEEALLFKPHDPGANATAARLAFLIGDDLKKAKEYAQQACELEPNVPSNRRTLGQIYAAAGLAANARRELEAALRLDPKDLEAKEALRGLGRR